MKTQLNEVTTETNIQLWMKRLTWALPLFFLLKGMMWLALPIVLTLYGLN